MWFSVKHTKVYILVSGFLIITLEFFESILCKNPNFYYVVYCITQNYNNTSRPAKTVSRLAATCKSDFGEAPTEMLGII